MDHRIRATWWQSLRESLTCTDQILCDGFCVADLPRSLRDIEVCLSVQAANLYHIGFRQEIGEKNTYVARLARQHPQVHPHLGRQLGEVNVLDMPI